MNPPTQPTPLHGAALGERFEELDEFLQAHQSLWRPRPFVHLELPWEAEHPLLAHWLRQRSLADAEADHHQPEQLLNAPEPFASLARRSAELIRIGRLPAHPPAPRHARAEADVPGRKLEQIEAFACALNYQQPTLHWVDWCAGKGHLGHRLARDGTALTCLEYDPALVQTGQALAERLGIACQHLQQDVMHDDGFRLQPRHTPIGLHACGDLHVRLLQQARAAGCRQLAIAPCCYNRIAAEHYQPLSSAASSSALHLDRIDLALPLSETVTGGARVRRQRDHSMARRLGFDLLQRRLRNSGSYLSTPSLPVAWLSLPFADYCRELAALKGFSIIGEQDWPALEAAGWQRLGQVRNLELLRSLFRRPLELWLNLDKALYLQEHGYQVRLGTFCDNSTTPRNLLLLAESQPVDNSVENP
jgi:hypothetical protein